MKKSKTPAKKNTASNDALKLGGLYVICFLSFQVANFIDNSIKNSSMIESDVLLSKALAQFGAFLTAYFITLLYIKNKN